MRTWLWTLLLAVIAVALPVMLREHAGNVLLLVPPWRVELSLTLAVLLLLALFVALYVVLRLLAWPLAIPERVRAWRGRRAQARDQELIEQGWMGILEGRYAHAEKDLGKLYAQTRVGSRRVLAALSAASAAHQMGEFARRDQLLESAREDAGGDSRLLEATAAVAADLLLQQGQPQRALDAAGAPAGRRRAPPAHPAPAAARREGARPPPSASSRWRAACCAATPSTRTKPPSSSTRAGAARLRAGMASGDGWRVIWKEMKAEERLLPGIALAASAAFEAAGDGVEAGRILRGRHRRQVQPRAGGRLFALRRRAGAAPACGPRRDLAAAAPGRRRPAHRPGHAVPERAAVELGRALSAAQPWRAATTRNATALLGSLYDRLNRPDDAVRQWRLATEAAMAVPVLADDAALPPADTGADPYRLDAEGEYAALATEPVAPVGAAATEPAPAAPPPAVDYVIDPDARELRDRPRAAGAAGRRAAALCRRHRRLLRQRAHSSRGAGSPGERHGARRAESPPPPRIIPLPTRKKVDHESRSCRCRQEPAGRFPTSSSKSR